MQLSSFIGLTLLVSIAAASGARAQPKVEFRSKIPSAPPELFLYALTPPDSGEVIRQVEKLLEQADPQRPLKLNVAHGDTMVAARDERGALRAWVDLKTGDAAIYPRLAKGSRGLPDEPKLLESAKAQFAELFARGDGRVLAGATRVVRHARAYSDNRQTPAPDTQLLYVLAQRQLAPYEQNGQRLNPLRVEGPGSRGLVGFDMQGRVQALARRWRTAQLQNAVVAQPGDIGEQIVKQLTVIPDGWRASVLSVSLVYYDGGRSLLQPAYRYLVELIAPDKGAESTPSYAVGYIPYADTQEPLPKFAEGAELPGLAARRSPLPAVKAPAISIGRYVARNTSAGFTLDANAFWNALIASPNGADFVPGDYLYSEPAMFTSQSQEFVHRMHVALIEGHGTFGAFSTDGMQDLVNIVDIPPPASVRGGMADLEHWVLHACSVLATPEETAKWAEPWWSVLGSVASVVGYHTPMYVNDGAGAAYGESLGLEGPRLSSWLSDLASLNAYGDNPYGCRAHERAAFGRAAAIARCDLQDGALSLSNTRVSATRKATCLDVWWLADSVARRPKPFVEPRVEGMCEVGGERGVTSTTYVEDCVTYDCGSDGCGGTCDGSECESWQGCSP